MRPAVLIALLVSLPAVSAKADERSRLYGSWGTERQCARAMIKPGGTVRAEPFEITPGWLRQGRRWCRLDWFPIEPRDNGFFTGAHALCGEDSARSYLLGMKLSGDQLTLRWDFPFRNGPLRRCPQTTPEGPR